MRLTRIEEALQRMVSMVAETKRASDIHEQTLAPWPGTVTSPMPDQTPSLPPPRLLLPPLMLLLLSLLHHWQQLRP